MGTETICIKVAQHLPSVVDGDLPAEVSTHIESCLRCHVEASRYRKIARELEKLASQKAEPPVDLVAPVLEGIEEEDHRRSRFRIAALGIGLGSFVVALGTVAGIALRLRHRIPTPSLARAS